MAEGQCSPANHHTAGKSTASQTQIPVPTAEQAEPQVTQQSLHNKPTCSLNHSPVTEPRLDKGLEALTVPLSPQGLPSHNPAANLLLEQVKLLQQAKLTRQPALPEAPLTLLIPIAQTGNGPPVTQRPAPQHVASPAKKLLVSDLTPVRAPASGACQGANRQLSPSDIFHAISSAAKPATEPPATEHTAADSAASPVAPSAIPATASTAVLAAAPLAAATSDVPASAHHSVPASVPSAVLTIASPTASTPPDNADRPAVVSNTLPLACSIGQPASSQSQASSVVGSLDLEHDGPVPAATEQRPVQSAGQGPHQHAKPICQSCLQHPAAEICPPAQVPVVAHPKAATAPNAAAVQSAAQPTAVEVPSQLVADVSAQPAAGTEGEKPDQATTVEPDAVAISAATEAMPGRVKRLPGGDPLEV